MRERARWNTRIREVWDRVSSWKPGGAGGFGDQRAARAGARGHRPGGVEPDDVRVEAVIGRVDNNGHLEETEVLVLPAVERQGSVAVFARDIVPERTGRLGYALRVSPNHFDDPIARPCTSLLKWSSVGRDALAAMPLEGISSYRERLP